MKAVMKPFMNVFAKPFLLSLAVVSVGTSAELTSLAHAQSTPNAPAVAPASDKKLENMADAEVRKLDKETGKITLKHGPIKSLDMPSMTMVFNIKDKALFEKIKAGDKIKFHAIKEGSQYVVTDAIVVP
jgi:Cu(I)/Ag(I) efflux system periplasmic protein CusF